MFRDRSFSIALLFSLLLAAITPVSVLARADPGKQIADFIKPFADKGHFYGVIIAKKDGKVVFERAYGLANADFRIPNQMNTRIGIASITKPMTMVIMIRLLEAKKLDLADKLSKYLPDFPNGDKITVEHLARHRAGIPHRVMPPEMESVPHTSEEMVEKIKKAKQLGFEPGEKSVYSSAGFTVLARICEIASGKVYAQLLSEYVFAPAGMTDSLDSPVDSIIERRALDYMLDRGGVYNAPLKDYSFLIGAGSVYGTAGDLIKFGEAFGRDIYGPASKLRYVTNGVFESTGSTNGHRANVKVDDSKKYSYAVLSNLGSGAYDEIVGALDKILAGTPAGTPVIPDPKLAAWTLADYQPYLGKYSNNGGEPTDMTLRNGSLYFQELKLSPLGNGCFYNFRFYGDVCAVRNPEGKITHMDWKSNGFTSKWTRQ